ncbi:hypothetical protein [Burkholderia sp. Ac-20365]|nr:hypothetical protein [Burkholderia sp. Ac-20365]
MSAFLDVRPDGYRRRLPDRSSCHYWRLKAGVRVAHWDGDSMPVGTLMT